MRVKKTLEVVVSAFLASQLFLGCASTVSLAGSRGPGLIIKYSEQRELLRIHKDALIETLLTQDSKRVRRMHFKHEGTKINFYPLEELSYFIAPDIPTGEFATIKNICYFTKKEYKSQAVEEGQKISDSSLVPYFVFYSVEKDGKAWLVEETNAYLEHDLYKTLIGG